MPAWINCYAMKTENILPDLTTPRVMAIVNVTPDSFFAGSRTPDAEAIGVSAKRPMPVAICSTSEATPPGPEPPR